MSAAKPKSAKLGNRPPVLVEDPAALVGAPWAGARACTLCSASTMPVCRMPVIKTFDSVDVPSLRSLSLQLPLDVQQLTEAPFQVTWQPAVYAVHASDGINLSTIKDAFKQVHVVSHITLSDLAARLDPADALCSELASAAAEGQQHAAAEAGRYGGSAHFLNVLSRIGTWSLWSDCKAIHV